MFIVPAHVLKPNPVRADVVPRVIRGGVALDDQEDVIQTDGGGRWNINWGEIDLDDIYNRQLWDAWTAHLAGGAQSVLVPILSLETAPRPIAGNGLAVPSDIVANDDWFPTSVGFASPHIIATVGADAAVRATSIVIDVGQGSEILPGMKFGLGGNRAYKVERVTARDGLTATCKITPPLRAAIEAGDPVEFDWPVVECRAVIGQTLAPDISFGLFGTVSVSFVEHITYGD